MRTATTTAAHEWSWQPRAWYHIICVTGHEQRQPSQLIMKPLVPPYTDAGCGSFSPGEPSSCWTDWYGFSTALLMPRSAR